MGLRVARRDRRQPGIRLPGTGSRLPLLRSPAGLLLAGTAVAFVLLVSPVVFRGTPLADDYHLCLVPATEGYGPFFEEIWQDTGTGRPTRFIELFLVAETCGRLPFGMLIAVPLALKVTAGFLLYGLLRDLRLPSPWPELGGVMWFLEPLGTEAALWPSALHVHFGLTLALLALRLHRRGRTAWAGLATLGACLSVEQVIFALPLAVWLVCPPDKRRRATTVTAAISVAVLAMYATWPGQNPRQAVPLAERFQRIFDDPTWYVEFPAVGLGLHSGPVAFLWALPYSAAVLFAMAVGAALLIPVLLRGGAPSEIGRRSPMRGAATAAPLILLINLPLIVTEVGKSPRTFTPTWLALSAVAAILGSSIRWKRLPIVGLVLGTLAAFAVLSLALSVSVRVRTVEFNKAAARWIADQTRDGDVVAVCDVERTVVNPAPAGAFHLHAFHSESGRWIEYHTGRQVELRRSGLRYWGSRCPDLEGADLITSFPELVREVDRSLARGG